MEPVSMSLMAISATGMALRRATADEGEDNTIAFPSARLDHDRAMMRSSMLDRIAACTLSTRGLFTSEAQVLADRLGRFAVSHGVSVHAQVALSAIFEAEDDPAVATSLRQRRADFVVASAEGTVLCGVEVDAGNGPTYRDAARRQAFARAGVPYLVMPVDVAWPVNRARLMAALGMETDAPAQTEAPQTPAHAVA